MQTTPLENKPSIHELTAKIRDGSATVGLIGLGVVGFTTVRLCLAAGYSVVGFDINPEIVAKRQKEVDPSASCRLEGDPAILADADVIIVAIRLEAPYVQSVQDEAFDVIIRNLCSLPNKSRLVILESTLKPGATDVFAARLRQSSAGHDDVLVAYCSERLRVGDDLDTVAAVPRLVGGESNDATEAACLFFTHINISPVPVTSPRVAELSKLLENAFISAGICLLGEITALAHRLGIRAHEVAEAAATKPHGYMPFWPGPGIGGHCLPNDLKLLQNLAADLSVETPFLDGIEAASQQLNATVLAKLDALLQARGRALTQSRVWLIGVGFKVGTDDMSNTPAVDIVRRLKAYDARVVYSDAQVERLEVDGEDVERSRPGLWPSDVDAALVLAGDATICIDELVSRVPVVLDTAGGRIMAGNSAGVVTL